MPRPSGKLAKFGQLPTADRRLVLRAVIWLGIARIMLITMPFQRLSERLAAEPNSAANQPDPAFVQRVGFAVRAAANNVPWRSDCFPQTIAARMLLNRRGYASTIHLGVEKAGEDGIAGHAWLTCGDMIVTGGEDLDRYTEMYRINA